MANDHHQSAFDKDGYDLYDTFDVPVAGDPHRQGLFGGIGRLLDQIRIDNAANKLAGDVYVGEDRALTGTGNWGAVPHEQLYASVHTNNNPAEAYALAGEWTQLGNMMAENSRVMDATIRDTETGWTGPAADVARQATLKLATWGGDAAQTSQYMGTRIADQGLAAERAKAAMPEPVNFDYEQILLQGFATGGLAGFATAVQDVQVKSQQARTAHQQAAQVMADMETQSRTVDETTPRFVRPPEVTDEATKHQDGLMRNRLLPTLSPTHQLLARTATDTPVSERLTPAGFEGATPTNPLVATTGGGTGLPGGTTPAYATGMPNIPAGGAGPDFTTMTSGVPGGSQPGGTPTYTPPRITVPDFPGGGTTTAGYTPNLTYTGGHPGGTTYGGPTYRTGGYDPTNLLPPGVTGLRGPGGDSSYSPGYTSPKINPATGLPFTPDEIRRGLPGMRGGVPGMGGGGGGAGGMGGGAGGFGRGMGQSLGAVAAAEQAAVRGAAGAGMSGQPGAPGQAGMGGAGHGAKSGGDDDKEHRNKYATNEKIIEEPGRMVPSVIGRKSAKQGREEQGG